MCYSRSRGEEMKISEKLIRLRAEYDLTQAELGKIAGASNKTVSAWERGEKTPRLKYVQAICNHFGIDMYDFVDEKTDDYKKRSPAPGDDAGDWKKFPANVIPIDFAHLKRIPILGRIAAGKPIYAEENIEGYTYTDLNGGHEYFGLRVRGDSMDAARIHDGDVVIIRRQDVVDNGQIAVCLIDGEEATLKRFSRDGDIVTLMPQSTNPVHHALVYDISKTHVDILGLVVRVEFSPA